MWSVMRKLVLRIGTILIKSDLTNRSVQFNKPTGRKHSVLTLCSMSCCHFKSLNETRKQTECMSFIFRCIAIVRFGLTSPLSSWARNRTSRFLWVRGSMWEVFWSGLHVGDSVQPVYIRVFIWSFNYQRHKNCKSGQRKHAHTQYNTYYLHTFRDWPETSTKADVWNTHSHEDGGSLYLCSSFVHFPHYFVLMLT